MALIFLCYWTYFLSAKLLRGSIFLLSNFLGLSKYAISCTGVWLWHMPSTALLLNSSESNHLSLEWSPVLQLCLSHPCEE